MKPPLAIALSILFLALAAPAASQSEASSVTNLGLAADRTVTWVDGDKELVLVSETLQGNTDLNGDGDALDQVLHVHDASAATTTNLGVEAFSASLVKLERGVAVFVVPESASDLNGDGDVLDTVLHHYDTVTGVVTNLGLATQRDFGFDGRRIALLVNEWMQGGTDLNGNGGYLDDVYHVHDLSTATTRNLGLAGWHEPRLAGDLVAVSVHEAAQGATDLNGDADVLDYVLHLHDYAANTTTNVGLDSRIFYVAPGLAAFLVMESEQGGTDLNGDGDALDSVLHRHDVAAATTTNVGLHAYWSMNEGGHVVLVVDEAGQGATDLNGDGDALDLVVHEHELASGATANLGLATINEPTVDGHRLLALVYELDQGGTDLNGDGDALDRVLHTRDLVVASTVNTGLAGTATALACNLLGLSVSEASQGGLDLNGDGDSSDQVLHVLDQRTGATTNLAVAVNKVWGEGNALLFEVPEASQGGLDLNGDGDALDIVLHYYDPASPTAVNLSTEGVHVPLDDDDGDRNLVAATAYESLVGADLNGDGDQADAVAQLVVLDIPYGLTGDADRVPLAAGGGQDLALDCGPDAAGDLYVVLGSASGTSPGIPFGAHVLPLNYDGYWHFTATNPNTPILSNSLSLLDGQGGSLARFALPAGTDPTLAGATLHHAYLVMDVATWKFSFTSNAFGVKLVS